MENFKFSRFVLIFLVLLGLNFSLVVLNSCQNLTTSNEVYLLNFSPSINNATCFNASGLANIKIIGTNHLINGSNNSVAFNITDSTNVTFINMSFDNLTYGIYAHNCSNLSVFNSSFKDGQKDVYIYYGGVAIVNNVFNNSNISLFVYKASFNISDNRFYNSSTYSIFLDGDTSYGVVPPNYVYGNRFVNPYIAVNIGRMGGGNYYDNVILNCSNSSFYIFDINGFGSNFFNNTISGNNSCVGIYSRDRGWHNITGNTISDVKTAIFLYPYYNPLRPVNISNNLIYNVYRGIYMAGSGNLSSFVYNNSVSNASYGVYLSDSYIADSLILLNISGTGLEIGKNNKITNSLIDRTNLSIDLDRSYYNNITNLTISNTNFAFIMSSSRNNTIYNMEIYNVSNIGIYVNSISYNNLFNNITVFNSTGRCAFFQRGAYNNLINRSKLIKCAKGVEFNGVANSPFNRIENSLFDLNSRAIEFQYYSSAYIVNSNITNANYGVYHYSTGTAFIFNCNFVNTTTGIYLAPTPNRHLHLENSTLLSTSLDLNIVSSRSNITLINNTFSSFSGYNANGIYVRTPFIFTEPALMFNNTFRNLSNAFYGTYFGSSSLILDNHFSNISNQVANIRLRNSLLKNNVIENSPTTQTPSFIVRGYNITIVNNSIINSPAGFGLFNVFNSTFYNNSFSLIDYVLLAVNYSYNVSVFNQSFGNCSEGVVVENSNLINIFDLNVNNCSTGISLNVTNSTVFRTNISYTDYGLISRYSYSLDLYDLNIINSSTSIKFLYSKNIDMSDSGITNSSIGILTYNLTDSNFTNITFRSIFTAGLDLTNSGGNVFELLDILINGTGVHINSSTNSTIKNSTIITYNNVAIVLNGSRNVIRNNYLFSPILVINVSSGIGNLIFNNIINGSNPVEDSASSNYFNTSLSSGSNIIHGSVIGGNYYAKPNGTGYSQICIDSDADFICDEPLTSALNRDYLPLSSRVVQYRPGNNTVIGNYVNLRWNVDNNGLPFNCTLFLNTSTISLNENESNYSIYLADGNYTWYVSCSINGSVWNTTHWYYFEVISLNLTLTSLPSWVVVYPTQTNVSCTSKNPYVLLNLYRNSSLVDSGYSYVEEVNILGVGTYLYICNISDTENYTNTSVNGTLIVLQGTPLLNLQMLPSSTVTYPTQTNVSCTGPTQLLINLYRDGVLVASGYGYAEEINTLPVGHYNYTCNTSGNQNYSSAEVSDILFVVNPSPPKKDMFFNYTVVCPDNKVIITVYDEDNDLVDNARVVFRWVENPIEVEAGYTNSNGQVSFYFSNDGNYSVTITESHHHPYTDTIELFLCNISEGESGGGGGFINQTVNETIEENENIEVEQPHHEANITELNQTEIESEITRPGMRKENKSEIKEKRPECCLMGICSLFGIVKILGICWYWWLLLIIILIIAYLSRRKKNNKKQGHKIKKK